MKINILLIALIILGGVGATHFLDNQNPTQSTYNQVENFKVELLSGEKSLLLKPTNDKDIIIHFWATWCPPCLAELPDLMAFAQENKKDVRVLAVAVQDDSERIKEFINKNNIHTPQNVEIVLDPDWKIAKNTFKTHKLPESFYLNKDGLILARHNGVKEKWLKSPWIEKFTSKNK